MKLNQSEREVIDLIHNSNGISRKALSEATGLSQASITNVTKSLVQQNYILEGERVGNGLGRKEVQLYPNPMRFKFLGIDIGGFRLRLAIANNNLEILYEREHLIKEINEEEDIMEGLVRRIDNFLKDVNVPVEDLDAIGVGVTGIVDNEQRRIVNIPNLDRWNDLPISEVFGERYKATVYLDESGRTMALAEKLRGKASTYQNFAVVHLAFGIVAGIMVNGQPVRGMNNVGGLLGHIMADESAGQCLCGNYGCLELIATYPMFEENYEKLGGKESSIVEAYQLNDKTALNVCMTAGNAIGVALSSVVNLFNPEALLLGGPVFEKFPLVFDEMKRTLLMRANRFATVGMKFEKSSFGDREGLMGALAMANTQFISKHFNS